MSQGKAMTETPADKFENMSNLFEQDHLKATRMLDNVQALCVAHSYLSAAKLFGEFRQLQEHHLDSEDSALEVLFRVEECTHALREAFTREHLGIRVLMNTVSSAISQNDEAVFLRSVEVLGRAVLTHNQHETQQFLPTLFRGTPPERREGAVRRIVS